MNALESHMGGRGEVWLCTWSPSDFPCLVAPAGWDCWFPLLPVLPYSSGSSRGEPKWLHFRLGVNTDPRGAAQQISEQGVQPGLGRPQSVMLGFIPGLSKGCSEQFLRKPVTGKPRDTWTGLLLEWEFVWALWYHFMSILLPFDIIL